MAAAGLAREGAPFGSGAPRRREDARGPSGPAYPGPVWARVTIVCAATGAGVGAFCARALAEPERTRLVSLLARSARLGQDPLRAGAAAGAWDVLTLVLVTCLPFLPAGRLLAALSLGLRATAAGWAGGLLVWGFGVRGVLAALLLVWVPTLALLGIATVLLDPTLTRRVLAPQQGRGANAVRLAAFSLAMAAVVAWQAWLARPVGNWIG